MSKKALNTYLIVLGLMILFALSPFAAMGGLLIAFVLVIPFGILLKAFGFEVKGQTFEEYMATAFFAVSLVLALLALWQFLRASSAWDANEYDTARRYIATASTFMTVPLLIFLFYRSVPGLS